MLETPLYGRFVGENRRLLFAPSDTYNGLIALCSLGGAGAALAGLYGEVTGTSVVGNDAFVALVGLAVCFAGLWAGLSLTRITFDLKERTYRRWQGPGMLPRITHGRLEHLDALVVVAEPNLGGVTYHLVLHWKMGLEPLMVLQRDTRALPAGAPLNAGAAPLVGRAQAYAKALGLPLYDNTHFPSPCPLPLFS